MSANTEVIVLRPLNKGDYCHWLDLVNKKGHKSSKDDLEKRFHNWIELRSNLSSKDVMYDLSVFDKVNNNLVGIVNLIVIARTSLQLCNINYSILPSYQRKGYGKEAVNTLVKIAFKELKLHRIEVAIEPDNTPSINLIKSIGFKKEGLREKYQFHNEKWVDLLFFYMTAEMYGLPDVKPSVRLNILESF